jgi:hypothetical protein
VSFKIHAEITDPETGKQERETGTCSGREDTKQEALKRARELREQGFTVTVTGPDGKPVEESNEADRT